MPLDSTVRFEPQAARVDIAVGRGGRAISFPWNNRYARRTRRHATGYTQDAGRGLSVQLDPKAPPGAPRAFLVFVGDRAELKGTDAWETRAH